MNEVIPLPVLCFCLIRSCRGVQAASLRELRCGSNVLAKTGMWRTLQRHAMHNKCIALRGKGHLAQCMAVKPSHSLEKLLISISLGR